MATECVRVECYAGQSYPTEPRAFTFGGVRRTVREITRRWKTPNALLFQVVTHDDEIFTLAYYQEEYAWVVLDTQ